MTGFDARSPADRAGAFAPRLPERDTEGYVHAILGPTNTGKTHFALERLLAHPSGIIGFPLRLLARENYEKMVARKGASRVALITGEEKIIPPDAAWFSCTVEAMPVDRPVSFLAVDEIQLCADPERGHIFTSRLLHARGRDETLFLGAETIAPLMRRLVSGISIDTRPRLSALTAIGHIRLEKLPPRTAIVAFSASEIYAIAELIRSRRGGCAVVMGQMSPRTRNAQVALYQDREVDYLVATDAIGMGLNMDIAHVAFAGLSKFDGARRRHLTAAEIAQIAGRAGRGTKDGTFGTTGRCTPLPEAMVEAVENHQFEPLERLVWRNDALDFTSPRALLSSLSVAPPLPGLQAGDPTGDELTLATLLGEPQVMAAAISRARTRLLWEVCQIPDFRKIGERSHAQLCAQIFTLLTTRRRLPPTWLEEQIARLDRTDGDVDTLMQRLAGIRVWSYISNRENWVAAAQAWQERTRAVEDRVSDALHERLTARFVDRRSAHLIRLLENEGNAPLLSAVRQDGEVIVEGHVVGHMRGFELELDPQLPSSDRTTLARAARRAMGVEIPVRVAACVATPDDGFAVDLASGTIRWKGAVVARLRPGRTVLAPEIETRGDSFLDVRQRQAVSERITAFFQTLVQRELAPLFRLKTADVAAASRGAVHELLEGVGLARREPVPPHSELFRFGVRSVLEHIYLPALLKPRVARFRALLLAVHANEPVPSLPPDGAVSVPLASFPAPLLTQLGWMPCGPIRLRIDMADRLTRELLHRTRMTPSALRADFAPYLGVKAIDAPAVLRALGFHLSGPENPSPPLCGPRPAWMVARKKVHVRPPSSPGRSKATSDSPFNVLAALFPVAAPPPRPRKRQRRAKGNMRTTVP